MILWQENAGFNDGDGITFNGKAECTQELPVSSINQLVRENLSSDDFKVLLSANNKLVFIVSFIDSQWRKDETSHLFIVGKHPNTINYFLTDTDQKVFKRWKCNVNLEKRQRPVDLPL